MIRFVMHPEFMCELEKGLSIIKFSCNARYYPITKLIEVPRWMKFIRKLLQPRPHLIKIELRFRFRLVEKVELSELNCG